MPETLLLPGDCREVLRVLPDASVDAVVCDPPYELGFMAKAWDAAGIAFDPALWRAVLRVLKPGGYLLAFGGTRTYHRMTVAIEDAGFEVRDCIGWTYGSGFPKSLDVSKAIDKASGAEREVVGVGQYANRGRRTDNAVYAKATPSEREVITAPATDDARRWSGWGTALKPAWEPIVVARAPFPGTVAANVLKHGTGALNIDGCRVAGAAGRWPANLILSHGADCEESACAPGCPVAALDAQQEGASRFFKQLPIEAEDFVPFTYVAKASRSEREAGCDALPARTGAEAVDRAEGSAGLTPRAGAGRSADKVRNHHPTVKPVSVMRWCIRLVTPPGGVVLDPFLGSGSTGIAAVREGANFIGIEREAEYRAIAEARIAHAKATPDKAKP